MKVSPTTRPPPRRPFHERHRRALVALGGLVALLLALTLGVVLDGGGLLLALLAGAGAAAATFALPRYPRRPGAARVVAAALAFLVVATLDPPRLLATSTGGMRLQHGSPAAKGAAVRAMLLRGVTAFDDAALEGVDLADVWLPGASFARADLRDAVLSRTILTRATLVDARLSGANLTEALLADADLTGADVNGIVGFETANCTAGSRMPAGWTCMDAHPRRVP